MLKMLRFVWFSENVFRNNILRLLYLLSILLKLGILTGIRNLLLNKYFSFLYFGKITLVDDLIQTPFVDLLVDFNIHNISAYFQSKLLVDSE